MIIQRYDAVVNIVYNALAQDHPGVLLEQRAPYDDGSHPGDVFHPDYQHGRPTSIFLFAVPLSHLLFPPLLHVLEWLLLRAAGEVAKNEKHLAAV